MVNEYYFLFKLAYREEAVFSLYIFLLAFCFALQTAFEVVFTSMAISVLSMPRKDSMHTRNSYSLNLFRLAFSYKRG